MKNSHNALTASTRVFEIKTIEEWLEDNSSCTTILCCDANEFKIIWLKKGSGLYNNEDFDIALESGFVFCLHSAQQVAISVNNDAQGYIISFTANFLKMNELEYDLGCHAVLLQMFSKTTRVSIDDELQHDLNEIITRLIKEYINSFVFKTELLRRYLKIFLIYISRAFEVNFKLLPRTRNSELVQKFMDAVEKNYRDKKMVAEYADMLFVTPNYLNEIIKKITGYSAGHHIRCRIATEAKRMALHSDNSMKEIAYSLGFIDCAHFSKFFKTITGSNFTDFKKKNLL